MEDGAYVAQALPSDGIVRSRFYPGLWLDVAAIWANDRAKMLAVLNAGIATPDHEAFVERLAAAKAGGARD